MSDGARHNLSATEWLLEWMLLPEDSPLAWEPDHRAVNWKADGSTAAFREEIERCAHDLADEDVVLPAADLATAIYCARELIRIQLRFEPMSSDPTGWDGPRAALTHDLRHAPSELGQDMDEVELPMELLGRPFASVELAAFTLRDLGRGKDPSLAKRLKEGLRSGWPLGADLSEPSPSPKAPTMGGSYLAGRFHRIDPDELVRFLQSRTKRALPPPRHLDLGPLEDGTEGTEAHPTQPKGPAHGRSPEAMAALKMARSMAAAVHLPRPGLTSEDLTRGGYTDLSNRGSLERLLLSELSHDDDILATRLVLGEALFLRRETSAASPTSDRHVLVDFNVRSWGMTRLVQGAAAIAAALDAPLGASVTFWIASSGELRSLDLDEPDDLSEHLGVLGETLHGADLLMEFQRRTEVNGGPAPERVLVVPKKTLLERPFREALTGLGASFVIAAGADGELEVTAHSGKGTRTLRTAQVDVAQPEPQPLTRRDDSNPELPAYAREWPAPLLLKHNAGRVRWRRSATNQDLYFALSRDMRVLVWDERERLGPHAHPGGQEIGVLPRGELLYFHGDGDGVAIALWHKRSPWSASLWSLSLDRRPVSHRVPLQARPKAVFCKKGVFVIAHPDRIDVVQEGRVRSSHGFSEVHWQNHYLRAKHQHQWERLDLEGSRVVRVPSTAAEARAFHGEKDQVMDELPALKWVYKTSFARPADAISFHMTDDAVWIHLEEKVNRALGQAKGDSGFRLYQRGPADSAMSRLTRRMLAPLQGEDEGVGRFLRRADWSSGSKAWTDRRGLLHLESGDSEIGSLTIALHVDTSLVAWSDRGWSTMSVSSEDAAQRLGTWVRRFVAHVVEGERS